MFLRCLSSPLPVPHHQRHAGNHYQRRRYDPRHYQSELVRWDYAAAEICGGKGKMCGDK